MKATILNRTMKNAHVIMREDAKYSEMNLKQILHDVTQYLELHGFRITDYMEKELKGMIRAYQSIAKRDGFLN